MKNWLWFEAEIYQIFDLRQTPLAALACKHLQSEVKLAFNLVYELTLIAQKHAQTQWQSVIKSFIIKVCQ